MNINGTTKTMGLIGNPVEHTLSPLIHNTISKKMNIPAQYMPFRVEDSGLEKAIYGSYELNILGLNVTVPYKEKVMQYLVEIDDDAKRIGAVNTLVRSETKHGFKGYNTDMLGLQRQIHEEGIHLKDKIVVVLGAGGAAKAVTYMAYLEEAKKIYVLNRTYEKAKNLAKDMNQTFNKKSGKDFLVVPMLLSNYNEIREDKFIVFQATSIGLYPNNDQVVIEDHDFYQKIEYGIDLIYNPSNTRFMQLVTDNHGKAYNALKMLLYQGVIAYELWNKVEVPKEIIEDLYLDLKRKVYPKDNIVLIGFMGSGKSAIGKELAKRRKMNFIDTDTFIEEKEGMTISDIFSTKGEEYFRALELKTLEYLRDHVSNTVFATGGGMPLQSKNASLLKEIGFVIYLEASSHVIYERIKYCKNRPLLQCEDPYNKICELMKVRKEKYRNTADYIINTNSNNKNATIEAIETYGKEHIKGFQ